MSPGDVCLINPEALGAPKGYSNGVRVPAGRDLLFVAGQVGWDGEQRIVGDGFADQFRQALENVVTTIEAAGGSPTDLVRMTVYVTDKEQYCAALKQVGAAWRELVGRHFPAMTLVQVAALLEPGAKVELEATAALPRDA